MNSKFRVIKWCVVVCVCCSLPVRAHDESTMPSREARLKAMLAESAKEHKQDRIKTIALVVEKLTDSRGLTYVGATVNAADVAVYLEQMERELGSKQFIAFRANQAARDHQQFHLTLIAPFELQQLKQAVPYGKKLSAMLYGLGRASASDNAEHQSYFIVAGSEQGQMFRQALSLPNKDFHITLGFNPQDVFGVSKGQNTLIE